MNRWRKSTVKKGDIFIFFTVYFYVNVPNCLLILRLCMTSLKKKKKSADWLGVLSSVNTCWLFTDSSSALLTKLIQSKRHQQEHMYSVLLQVAHIERHVNVMCRSIVRFHDNKWKTCAKLMVYGWVKHRQKIESGVFRKEPDCCHAQPRQVIWVRARLRAPALSLAKWNEIKSKHFR